MERVKRSGVGGRKREEKIFSPLLLPSFLLSPQDLPLGLLFLLSLIFLRHNKDGGYNGTNINKQLSPAQNTPALQANNNGSLSYISYHYSSRRQLPSLPPVKLVQTACLGVKIHPRFMLLILLVIMRKFLCPENGLSLRLTADMATLPCH